MDPITENEQENTFQVQMFGIFRLQGEGRTLAEEDFRSPMLIRLLSYILLHHDRSVTPQELTEVLWPDVSADISRSALKNLVYRLRNLLKSVWKDKDLIVSVRRSYSWNPAVPLRLDVEELDRLGQQLRSEQDKEKRRELLIQAMSLYQGKYLENYCDTYQIASQSAFSHSRYLSMAKELSGMLWEAKQYQELEVLLKQVLRLEEYDEELQAMYIRSLLAQGKTHSAFEAYQRAVIMFYEELGISRSEVLQSAYEEILQYSHQEEPDLQRIRRELEKDMDMEGAFFCEEMVFRKIYQLELRRSKRLGISMFLSLMTIGLSIDEHVPEEKRRKYQLKAMDVLKEVLLRELRSGDVLSKYSATQFMILLPTCQFETAKKVMQRIRTAFNKKYVNPHVRLQFNMTEME